jgi:hypothetical protein
MESNKYSKGQTQKLETGRKSCKTEEVSINKETGKLYYFNKYYQGQI